MSRLPFHDQIEHDAVLVIDLRDRVDIHEKPWIDTQPTRAGVILIAGATQAVPAAWLQIAGHPHVQLLLTRSPADLDEPRLRSAVLRAFQQNLERVVAAVRERCGPQFDDLEDVIRIVVGDPWGIRRPRDLARALGISPALLRKRCGPVAGGRVDHVLAFIRFSAYSFLAGDCHLPVATALEAVGVRDPSNFRRQVRRAQGHTGGAP